MATNQSTVGADLYAALQQFFQLFPEHRSRDFYVTGESYAGKYVPACAYTIHTRNVQAPAAQQINLRGISIGDGAFDPPNQLSSGFGALLYNLGMATEAERRHFEEYEKNITTRLEAGDPVGAIRAFDEMLNGDYYGPSRTFYGNTTGMGSNYFNYAEEPGAASLTKRTFPSWLQQPEIASALHVGATPYSVFNQTVEDALIEDWVVGVVPWLQTLLDHYDVLIYSGQYDVILGPPGTERAIDKLQWSGAVRYANAPTRQFFSVSEPADLAGYVRQARSSLANTTFSYVMLRGCGHMVPTDQPRRAYEMLGSFLVDMAPLP